MSFVPKPQEIYKHFKGNLYQVITLAKHSETGEQMVVYQALYGDYSVYVRPLDMFVSKVDKSKYPESDQEYRFELLFSKQTPPTVCEEKQSKPLEEVNLDPQVIEFLDAGTYEERLNILAALRHRITDEMITTMAIASDVEVGEGDTIERYESLRSCLLTLERYECNRLR